MKFLLKYLRTKEIYDEKIKISEHNVILKDNFIFLNGIKLTQCVGSAVSSHEN